MPGPSAINAPQSQDSGPRTAEGLYDVYGDTSAALETILNASDTATPSQDYNRILLEYLSSCSQDSSTTSIVEKLNEWQDNKDASQEPVLGRNKLVEQFVVTYNNALIQFANGNPRDAAAPLLELLKPFVTDRSKSVRDELVEAASNSAFLLLDCILTISEARHKGIQQLDPKLTTDSIIAWLDTLDFDSRPRLKFLLALYKSRLDFAARDASGRMIDSKVKNVRKELKLRPDLSAGNAAAESSSIGSSSNLGEDSSIHSGGHLQQQVVPGNHQEALIQSLNQSALNLKANWEQLKGNTKKSLVLCAEARSPDPVYESTHANNLAVVYASCGKRQLALHSTARALRTLETPPFRLDGTATPDSTLAILHNSAILAFQAQKFTSAYECMALCVISSKEYAERPRCWLRMAESCIGKFVLY